MHHLEWQDVSGRSTRRDACSMSVLCSRCLHVTITFNSIAAWDWSGLSVEQPIHSNLIIWVQRECIIRVSFNEDRPVLGLVGLLTRPSIMILGGDWETLHLRASRIGGGWQCWLDMAEHLVKKFLPHGTTATRDSRFTTMHEEDQ
jgi:hypothetical protein